MKGGAVGENDNPVARRMPTQLTIQFFWGVGECEGLKLKIKQKMQMTMMIQKGFWCAKLACA